MLQNGVPFPWPSAVFTVIIAGAAETSGNTFDLVEVYVNCEQNSLLFLVRPRGGGICHTKNREGQPRNCFYRRLNPETGQLEHADP